MVCNKGCWEPGVQYCLGDQVDYEGSFDSSQFIPLCLSEPPQVTNTTSFKPIARRFGCVRCSSRSNRSPSCIDQGDWTPPVTPALWGRVPDQCKPCGEHTYGAPDQEKPPTYQGYQHEGPPPQQDQPKPQRESAIVSLFWYEN